MACNNPHLFIILHQIQTPIPLITYSFIHQRQVSLFILQNFVRRHHVVHYLLTRPKTPSFTKPSWLLILLIFLLSLLTFFRQWRQNNDVDNVTNVFHQQPPPSSLSASECTTRGLGQSSSPDFKGWKFFDDDSYLTRVTPKICITSTTSAGLEEVLPWIYYHKVVGISNFFLFVEGKAASPNVSKVPETIPGVKVISRTRELEVQQAQSLLQQAMQQCVICEANPQHGNGYSHGKARDSGMEWILHVDTDELLHPEGTRNYSMRELLANVPSDVDAVVFSNYVILFNSKVSLFKKNFDHLPNDSNFELYKMATRGNPNYFLTYANGKSAARIQDHLRPNGAHQWYNYFKEPKEIILDEAAILHYTYARFSDLTSRRDRCNCQPTEEDVKRCFWLEFDRSAFIIASFETHERMLQWYRDHVVCNTDKMNRKLLKYGILTRIYTPMVIIQKLRESGIFASIISSAQDTSP